MNIKKMVEIISIGIMDPEFQTCLMTNCRQTLIGGYMNEKFDLSRDEIDFLASIQARDFQDFSQQLQDLLTELTATNENGHSNGHLNGNYDYYDDSYL